MIYRVQIVCYFMKKNSCNEQSQNEWSQKFRSRVMNEVIDLTSLLSDEERAYLQSVVHQKNLEILVLK